MPAIPHHNSDTRDDIQIDQATLLTIQEHVFIKPYSNNDPIDLRDDLYPITFDDYDYWSA